MTVESIATRKLMIVPIENKGNVPIYQDQFVGYDTERVYFKSNPHNFNLNRAKKNPLFTGTVENYRQGDVLLQNISELPEGLESANSTVLAESFLTGNTHEFLYGNIEMLQDVESKDFYVVVKDHVAILGHRESQEDRVAHKAIVISPGNYLLKFQQTFVDNEPIRVID